MRRDAAFLLVLAVSACNKPAPPTPPATATQTTPAPPTSEPAPAPTASASAQPADDPISKQIASFDPYGLWTNGTSPKIDLPATASTEEVLTAMFGRVGFDKGHVKTHRVAEEREVHVGKDPTAYRAVLVETDLGRKVVLLRYESPATGWWTRAYDAH
jgi:hypothetical protein